MFFTKAEKEQLRLIEKHGVTIVEVETRNKHKRVYCFWNGRSFILTMLAKANDHRSIKNWESCLRHEIRRIDGHAGAN